MLKNLVTIKGKNGEVRQGTLKWIEGAHEEFVFYDCTSPSGMWGKLDYWKIIGEGVKINTVKVEKKPDIVQSLIKYLKRSK